MRALFEDIYISTGGIANPSIRVTEVVLPADANARDVWLYFYRASSSSIGLAVRNTRGLIGADTGIATITPGAGGLQEIAVVNGPAPPNITGMKVRGYFDAVPDVAAAWWWAYTAAPDLVVASNLAQILLGYTGAGQALADCPAGHIVVGDPGSAPHLPIIAIVPQTPRWGDLTGGRPLVDMVCPIECQIAAQVIQSRNSAWQLARTLQAAVWSIICDEQVYLKGESGGPVIPMDLAGPSETDNELMFVATVAFEVQFSMWRDSYPR